MLKWLDASRQAPAQRLCSSLTMNKTMNFRAIARWFCSVGILYLGMNGVLKAATMTPERNTIEDRFKWDLSQMYATQDDWDKHYQKLEGMISQFAGNKGTAGDSSKSLLETLKLYEQINVQLEKL